MKIGSFTVIPYFMMQMNFYPFFPHFLTNLGRIQSRRSAHNADE